MTKRWKRWLVALLTFVTSLLWLSHIAQQNIAAHQGWTGRRQGTTATPTLMMTTPPDPTPTVTSATFLLPLVIHQPPLALANGNFERGPVSWQESSQQHAALISARPELGGVAPHSGEWAAWLGGVENEVAVISQPVTIMAQRARLHYWVHILSTETTCHDDHFSLLVNAQLVIDQFDLCAAQSSDWYERTVDLRPWLGQTITLSWQVVTNGNGQTSNLFLDDIALVAVE